MKNFDYLKDIEELKDLYGFCSAAEDTQQTNHDMCALNSRRALEWIVRTIYTLKGVTLEKRTPLLELITGEPFMQFIGNDERMLMAIHYVRKTGNKAAHDGGVKKQEAFFSLLNIYNVVGGILLKLRVIDSLAIFDKTLIPKAPTLTVVPATKVPETPTTFVKTIKKEDVEKPSSIEGKVDFSEAETRRLFIDLLLEEAGWEVLDKEGAIVPNKACIEIEVHGMPDETGIGYADYVLFGSNGKPLAVVEAKRTTKEPEVGRKQASLYADCLEQQYGIRPVIYYTNGFKTFIVDGLGYPARQVQGFHTQEDLLVLLQRRGRNAITDLQISDEITNREYQKRAIRAICEHFNTMHRRGLLVMATGTGKTRVSISLCDVLMRNGWAKNILFLADRTALVKQAHKNFTKLLPSATTCVLNETKEPDMNARIMFSTYQTMINYIDTEQKQFSIGRFDLIVIDEVHRSIFGKYTSILSYFDALMVGLTATPREDNDKSTYDLFQMEGGEPNFAYELEEAVKDGYLVGSQVLARTTAILKNGIKYNDLSEEERKQMEGVWEFEKAKLDLPDETDFHRDIERNEIFRYIFNEDTISKVIVDLMENGQKINGGDTIGKTIIFAYNHDHAVLIVEKFKKLYPALGDDFCQLIDNYVNYAQSIIDSFEVRGKLPQIAVSVDMLDTGIDVPDILNLVFFKPVHSKIKFWQMIGRGTRLSEGIFDDGTDKQCFYIFDWCGNFEFFGRNPKGFEPTKSISLTERLFGLRVDLAIALQHQQFQEDEIAKGIHDETKEILQNQVKELNDNHISVREHWETVEKYRKADNWVFISNTDGIELKNTISPLLVKGTTNMGATKFDILLVDIELSMVDDTVDADKAKVTVNRITQKLQEKASIPQVKNKMELIKEVSAPHFWESVTLDKLEQVRKELRDLVQFITGSAFQTFTIDIKDVVEVLESPGGITLQTSYKQKVLEFLTENKDLPVLKKIMRMEQLDSSDIKKLEEICWKELGTKEDYEQFVAKSNMICGDSVGAFIRAQIGVDRHHAMEEFSKFLSDTSLNSLQEEYIKTIITYVCQNGDITLENLVNTEPFSEYEWIDAFGQSFVAVRNFVVKMHNIVRAANGESFSTGQEPSSANSSSSTNRRRMKAEEVRLVASGSVLTSVTDDNEVRTLIHNMMALHDGTTIEKIYVECIRNYQEKYFNMKPNDWRHLVSNYVKDVTEQQDLQDDTVFRYKSSIA